MVEKKAKREDFVRLRQRGRILSETGWQKLEEALQQWEERTDQRRTFEKVAAEAGLDPGTVAKIFKRREGADLSKIEQLLRAFQLNVEAIDHCPLPQGIAQSADPNFVGRAGAIADLNALVERGAKVIVIQARGGVGKTTLARKYLQQEFGSFLEFPIAKETKDIASIESLIEEKLKQLGEEPGREFLVSIDRLKRKLQGEAIGILIDNLEPALDSSGKFIEPHRRYVELLRVLSDPSVQSVTLITSRERLYEPSVSVQHYLLNSLDVAAWEQFFQLRLLSPDAASLAALHRAYGGNAKAMEIISSAIQTDYSGDVAAYWQANQDDLLIERALEDLVTQQFDRLQQLDQDAYNLLRRMGCYRYQDVPTVPIEGLLCLLWDVPEQRHRRVIKSLQDLSLIEFGNGDYWLHPVIRSEAIGRLRGSEGWYHANRLIAEFWKDSIKSVKNIAHALEAFEAYYHYVLTDDFLSAAVVILEKRGGDTLGRSFYKLGLFQQMLIAIDLILKKIDSEYHSIGLSEILGTLCRLTGNINSAIYHYEKSESLAEKYIKKINTEKSENIIDVFNWKTCASANIGICKLELRELEEALAHFQNIRDLAREKLSDKKFGKPYKIWIDILLAFTYSSLGYKKEASNLAQDAYIGIQANHFFGEHNLIFLGHTYRKLGEIEKSTELFGKVVEASEISNYTQAKANALGGLAANLRIKGNFQEAIENHLKSIFFLNEIGLKFDLAEANYQCGLTYQAVNETEKSNRNFREAIRLFTEMEAPKQVDRVRRSMQNNI